MPATEFSSSSDWSFGETTTTDADAGGRRDMDLVRELLLRLEGLALPSGARYSITPANHAHFQVKGKTSDDVARHLGWLVDGGFVDASRQGRGILFRSLTWRGCEYLDTIRDPEIWRQTKEGGKKVGAFSFELLADIAKGIIKKKISDLSGIELTL